MRRRSTIDLHILHKHQCLLITIVYNARNLSLVVEPHYHWGLNSHAPKLNDIVFGNTMVQIRSKYLLRSSKIIDLL
jgi:hypothetical protein